MASLGDLRKLDDQPPFRKHKRQRRRLGERIRELADAAWGRGSRGLAEDLHKAARRAETERAEHGGNIPHPGVVELPRDSR